MICDPRIVKNPVAMQTITYRELRELSYMGASVLHEDAIFPVRSAGIPINIKNTNKPDDEGTWIYLRDYYRAEVNVVNQIMRLRLAENARKLFRI